MTCFSTICTSTHALQKPVVMQACYCSITVAAYSLDAALSLILGFSESTVLQHFDVIARPITTLPREYHLQLEKGVQKHGHRTTNS
jgi:hypothetical protein